MSEIPARFRSPVRLEGETDRQREKVWERERERMLVGFEKEDRRQKTKETGAGVVCVWEFSTYESQINLTRSSKSKDFLWFGGERGYCVPGPYPFSCLDSVRAGTTRFLLLRLARLGLLFIYNSILYCILQAYENFVTQRLHHNTPNYTSIILICPIFTILICPIFTFSLMKY